MALRVLVVLALAIAVGPAEAQQPVSLRFANGRVWLRAQNAPVRTILAEWSRLGGATIVNGDRVAGVPVTLELSDVPERQALDIVLRDVAGYMIAPRRAGTTGISQFDRIVILPTSTAPRNPPPPTATAAAPPRAGFPRPVPLVRPGQQPPDAGSSEFPSDAATANEKAEEDQPTAGVVTTPQNPFGLPPGTTATPGVITPVPRQEPAQPNRVQ